MVCKHFNCGFALLVRRFVENDKAFSLPLSFKLLFRQPAYLGLTLEICERKERAQMKAGKAMRVALDVALTVMIVFEMLIQFTGEFLHEVVGFAFFATVVVHIALSAAWMKKTARNAKAGKLTARRTALAVIGCLLAVAVIVLGVSSVAISGILSSAGFVWPLGSYALWVNVHTVSSYALCGLVVIHLAMHWAFLASAFKVPYNPARRRAISTGVNAVAALGVVALGVTVAGKMAPQVAQANAEQSASEPTDASGASEPSTNSTGKHSGAGKSGKSENSSAGSTTGNSSGNSNSGSSSNSAPSSGSSQGSGTGAGASSDASGICTICRKKCPLSAPKCNKPYEQGLL